MEKMEEQGINSHINVHLRKILKQSDSKFTEDEYRWVPASMDLSAMYNPRLFWFPATAN